MKVITEFLFWNDNLEGDTFPPGGQLIIAHDKSNMEPRLIQHPHLDISA